MADINICLNCTYEECDGDYPYCKAKQRKKKEPLPKSKIKSLGRGNGTVLVCLLARLGITIPEIAKICDARYENIRAMIMQGRNKGLITDEEIDRISKRYKRKE